MRATYMEYMLCAVCTEGDVHVMDGLWFRRSSQKQGANGDLIRSFLCCSKFADPFIRWLLD